MNDKSKKLPYLNVGCGKKYNPLWTNVDMVADGPDVIAFNLIKGIPFEANTFEIVYHSQVLEHIPKENAPFFIAECFRVLKPGGTLRVVCPDLEGIATEYLKWMRQSIDQPTPESIANYDWMVLEMYDQTVRNQSGGYMAKYLQTKELINADFVFNRTGFIGRRIHQLYLKPEPKSYSDLIKSRGFLKKAFHYIVSKLDDLFSSPARRIGRFRLSGEIHQWMYDRYSLGRLMASCGFVEITKHDHATSGINDWASHALDVKDGLIYDPNSLFMEAKKPF
jgi:predicted SAM-dependent methyltransferase